MFSKFKYLIWKSKAQNDEYRKRLYLLGKIKNTGLSPSSLKSSLPSGIHCGLQESFLYVVLTENVPEGEHYHRKASAIFITESIQMSNVMVLGLKRFF